VATRRRRRGALGWSAVALLPSALLILVAWEGLVGPVSTRRPLGYVVVFAAAGLAVGGLVRRWGKALPTEREIARRIDRFFPQTRGGVAELDHPAGSPLGRAWQAEVRAWLAGRDWGRIAPVVDSPERRAVRGRRALAAGLALAALIGILAAPGPAGRVGAALLSPPSVWTRPTGVWEIVPGDARVRAGGTVRGRARFDGPVVDAVLVVERRPVAGAWMVESLGRGPAGGWSWTGVSSDAEYRLRYGPFMSPVHRLTVEVPLAVLRLEARGQDGRWSPLGGRTVPGGARLELRGESSHGLATARVELSGGRGAGLETRGRSFSGAVRPSVGTGRVVVEDVSGARAESEPFQVAAPGAFWVDLLLPADDPALLTAVRAWVEARAVSAAGLTKVGWETDDGRAGELGSPAGSRDTTLSHPVPLGEGAGPGDTLRFRVVATDASGRHAATGWRTAVVADRGRLAELARQDREAAAKRMETAIAEAREAGTPETSREGLAADERLREAADSLAAALERTLADPSLRPGLAERVRGYKDLLEGTSRARLAPPSGTPPGPGAEAEARADVLDAVRRGLADVDSLLAMLEGADSLARLAEAERALAERARRGSPEELAGEVRPRQDALAESARAAASALPDSTAAGVERALERAAVGVRSGDPAAASGAQEKAAAALSSVADEARASVDDDLERDARRRAALDRAGGEVLFLTDRQQELLSRMAGGGAAAQADRVARQRVVTGGLQRALGALVEAMGGLPAAADLGESLAQAVYLTRVAEERIVNAPGALLPDDATLAAGAAADGLARLARALLLPAGGSASAAGSGQGEGTGSSPAATAAELQAMAEAQRALADALQPGDGGRGGNPDAAAGQRALGRRLEELRNALFVAGVDPAALRSLEESVAGVAGRLERGLPGARMESDLRSLSRRFADLGRMVERSASERRKSRPAGPFLPLDPPPLPRRATAGRLDPEAALAPWRDALPPASVETGRAYLERLADEGVREPEPEGSP
jgi:hypothetical protein